MSPEMWVSSARTWLLQNRDLGPRYLAENTTLTGAYGLRRYGIGLILGLAAVGCAGHQYAGRPHNDYLHWSGLGHHPGGARTLRRSPQGLQLFCFLVGAGLAAVAQEGGAILLVALPRGGLHEVGLVPARVTCSGSAGRPRNRRPAVISAR
jgi:hypothetical protein